MQMTIARWLCVTVIASFASPTGTTEGDQRTGQRFCADAMVETTAEPASGKIPPAKFFECKALGCPPDVRCVGELCYPTACGTGACPLEPCGNLIVRAWCVYTCLDGKAKLSGRTALVFFSKIGNHQFGPYCLDA